MFAENDVHNMKNGLHKKKNKNLKTPSSHHKKITDVAVKQRFL